MRHSVRSARCSRAISRSTREPAVTRCCGMPANGLRPGFRQREGCPVQRRRSRSLSFRSVRSDGATSAPEARLTCSRRTPAARIPRGAPARRSTSRVVGVIISRHTPRLLREVRGRRAAPGCAKAPDKIGAMSAPPMATAKCRRPQCPRDAGSRNSAIAASGSLRHPGWLRPSCNRPPWSGTAQ